LLFLSVGTGLDEAPFAYKDINEVMQSRETLVDIPGRFYPAIVHMSARAGTNRDSADPINFKKHRERKQLVNSQANK
jgi:hypothetical protein